MIASMSTHSEKDCAQGACSTAPSPFANQPPLGLSLLAKDDPEDILPDWPQVAPDLPEDAYSIADALWWSRKLGDRVAHGADVAYMLRDAADARAVQNALAMVACWQRATLLEVWRPQPCSGVDSRTAARARSASQRNHRHSTRHRV